MWFELWLQKRRRAMVQRLQRVGCDRMSVLRTLATQTGFDLHRETDVSQWLIPFTYRRLAILYRRLKSSDDEIRVLKAALKNLPKSNRKHRDWFKSRLLKIEKLEQCPS